MANFWPKPWTNLCGKMAIFPFFELLVFIAWKGLFFVLEYRKTHFPGLYYLSKKTWKNGQFLTKTMDLWKNGNFSSFWSSCFYSLKRHFFVLEFQKTHFRLLYCLRKKFGNMANFRPKPWTNPFAKMTIFPLFELLVFID